MANIGLTHLQGAQPQTVIVRRLALLYISAVLKCRKNAKNVVLVQLETPRKLRYPQFVLVTVESFKDVQCVVDGLNDVIRFFSLCLS